MLVFVFVLPILLSLIIKYRYRQINYIFILLVSIGVLQGLCDNILFVAGYDSIKWGIIKAPLILFIVFITGANIFYKKKIKLPMYLVAWSVAFIALCLIIAGHIVEAYNDGYAFNVLSIVQNYSLLNMLMVYVAYFNYKEQLSDSIINMLVDIAKFVSGIAVIQWMIFKYYEYDLIITLAARRFGKWAVDDGESIRVFSVFPSHYGLSAFLTIITILYVSRFLDDFRRINYVTFSLLVGAHLLTFNLTGMLLTFAGCLFVMILSKKYDVSRDFPFPFIKPIRIASVKIVLFVLVMLFISLVFVGDLRQRLSSILEYSEMSSGAGNSLYMRSKFILTGLDLLTSHPNGIGLSLTDISKDSYDDLGYVRASVTGAFSADSWFLWLIVQIGIFWSFIFLFIYVIPFSVGIAKYKELDISVRWQYRAFVSLVFVILLGSMSNSPILNYPPSNILIWCAVGAIFAIASRRKQNLSTKIKQFRQEAIDAQY